LCPQSLRGESAEHRPTPHIRSEQEEAIEEAVSFHSAIMHGMLIGQLSWQSPKNAADQVSTLPKSTPGGSHRQEVGGASAILRDGIRSGVSVAQQNEETTAEALTNGCL
jgi:hypothetical protein